MGDRRLLGPADVSDAELTAMVARLFREDPDRGEVLDTGDGGQLSSSPG